jgi:PAS domain S-box-containing protein
MKLKKKPTYKDLEKQMNELKSDINLKYAEDGFNTLLKKSEERNDELIIANEQIHSLSAELLKKNQVVSEIKNKFKNLFDNSNISILEQDFSEAIELLNKKKSETGDIEKYLNENTDFVKECVSKIKILNVNKITLELVGVKDLKELRSHYRKTNSEKTINALKKELISIALGKKKYVGETEFVRRDGTTLYATLKSTMIDDFGTNFASVVNISERKEAEEGLKVSEENYRELVEQIPDGVYKSSQDGKFVEVNPAMVKMLGYNSKEELLAINLKTDFYLDVADRDSFTLNELNQELGVFQVRKKDGSVIWIEDHGWYSHKEQGEISVRQGSMRDVTENKISEIKIINQNLELSSQNEELVKREGELIMSKQKVEKSDELYRLAIAATNLGIWDWNVKEDTVYFSKLWKSQLGYKENELEDKFSTWQNLLHPDGFKEATKSINDYLKNPVGQYNSKFRLRHKDGSYIWISARAEAVMNKKREVVRMFGSHTDISESKSSENTLKIKNIELIKAKDKAEESDQLKSAFLSNMSHEIRTPMNGILGFSELLKEPDLTGETQREYIHIIEKSGQRMLNILNDIVSISKIESGLMEVNIQETDINEQIGFIHSFFKLEIEGKGIRFLVKNSLEGKEASIQSDSEKIYGILTNLIKNAIKFTKEGTIELGCRLRTEKESSKLEFYVKDTGIGIPKDRQKPIFDRFIQADVSGKMAYQGAGLGLSISKAYVEQLGGEIWTESEEGKGSIFYFTLPYQTKPNEKKLIEKD